MTQPSRLQRYILALAFLAVGTGVEAQTLTRGPLIQNPAALTTTMTVVWWTDVAGDSTVEYGTTPGLGSSVTVPQAGSCEIGAAGTCHTVPLTGLAPGTRYYYRLLTNGNQVLATTYFQTFKTPTDTTDVFFTMIGDWGAGSSAQANVANNQNASDPPLILTTGDNAYESGTQSDWDNNAFISQYENQILRRAVFFPSLGNHDLNNVGAANWASSVEIKMHALPRNAPAGQEERFFSFEHGDALFVVLDSNGPAITATQTNWLTSQLSSTPRKWKFVFFHHTPYSCANGIASIGSDTTVRNTWGPIFEQYGVDIVFEGHDHSYERSKVVDDYLIGGGSGSDGKGTIYVMTGGGGKTLDDAANADGGGPYRQPLFGSKTYCPWLSNQCPGGVAGQYCSFSQFHHTEVRIQNNSLLTVRAINQSNAVFDTFTINKSSVCGNGSVEAGEQCDQGAANGTSGSCCTSGCLHVANGTQCRASAGTCDVAESCSGSSGTCPADGKSTAPCRATAGVCDVAESCDGVGNDCPADGFTTGGICRAASGDCDAAETCDGSMAGCPGDAFAPSTTECRPAASACDQAESCTGSSTACPADSVAPFGTPCRAAASVCDIGESCDGASGTCPADGFAPSTVVCRASVGTCDVAESCTGSSGSCPADTLASSGTPCRISVGVCDIVETCSGASAACPSDGFAPSTTVCRAAAGACDQAESCSGSGASCPADTLKATGTVCRASSGPCDPAETCSGSTTSCPADTGSSSDSDGDTVCDPVDNCVSIANTTQTNGDTDTLGDACDPCTNFLSAYVIRPSLLFSKLNAPPGDDRFKFSGSVTVPTTPTIDPLSNDGVRILVTDSLGLVVLDATLPGGLYDPVGQHGWTTNATTTTYLYRNSGGFVPLIAGIHRLVLRRSIVNPSLIKFTVIGKTGTYPITPGNLPLHATLVLDPPHAANNQCGEALFPGPAAPLCAYSAKTGTVKCK